MASVIVSTRTVAVLFQRYWVTNPFRAAVPFWRQATQAAVLTAPLGLNLFWLKSAARYQGIEARPVVVLPLEAFNGIEGHPFCF